MIAKMGFKSSLFFLLGHLIKIIYIILSFLYGSFSLFRFLKDALTTGYKYDLSKILNQFVFKFILTLEEKFSKLSTKVSYDN